ncbi:MAG: hypothetical protein AAGB23_06895 [Pseudomonadota bacterium]
MTIFVLILLGVSLGWLSSILMRTETAGVILRQLGVGLAASLVGGLALNGGSMFGGLSLTGLGAGALAAIAALILYHAVFTRREKANL